VALGSGVGLAAAVGVAEGDAEGEGAAEGPTTGLVEGDASWLDVQPPISPTIPNTATTVESFMSFIAPLPLLMAGAFPGRPSDAHGGRRVTRHKADWSDCPIPDTDAAHSEGTSRQHAVDAKEARRRTVIAVALFAAVLVSLVVIAAIVLQGPGVMSIHETAKLPDRIHVCGRNFQKADPAGTLAAIRSSDGVEPVVVDTGPLAGCPANACTSAGCTTVVYVRVGEDAYYAYSLLGGP
jgi:hypothetical protein